MSDEQPDGQRSDPRPGVRLAAIAVFYAPSIVFAHYRSGPGAAFNSPEALAGMLAGAIGVGVVMAISSSNSGGAWDNAKKYIETGVHGGKGSETHKAAVVGDTVGDPMKDTSGPSLNILMKLMAIISLVFAPFIKVAHTWLIGALGF